jgi:hypothetical protein
MKRKVVMLTMCFFISMVTGVLPADEITIEYQQANSVRFPDNIQHLGFPKGLVLMVSAVIMPIGYPIIPITEVTAKNLDTGLILKLRSVEIEIQIPNVYARVPMPPLDPSKHLGVWEIRVKDEQGNEAVAKTHKLDKVGEMPYIKDIKASGNPLAPTITWAAPNDKDIPESCADLEYRVRLVKDAKNQYYFSLSLLDTKHQIPEGKLKSEDLSDTYIIIMCYCSDRDEKAYPLPIEFSSWTFRPLKEALGM